MKHNPRRHRRTPRVSPSVLERININAAGIDCGSAEHFVAVPPDRDPTPVRSFKTFTSDLHRLADWLTACRVKSVAMEATGVYWIPLYEILEARGFDVVLVNAKHVKNVPGRKSDVLDCEWLRELHSVGLLRGSFRPVDSIVALRAYLRHRETLIQSAGAHIQRMQKALVQMNLQLPLVVSDITGVTGLRILRDIVAGQRDPHMLAQHRDPRCQATPAEIVAALTGNYRPEHLFVLSQNLELFDACQQQLAACDTAIEAHMQTLTATLDVPAGPLPDARVTRKPRQNEPRFEIRTPLHQLTGVDLTQIDGIAPYTALKLVSEIGTDMRRWPSEKHFTSWLTLAPEEQSLGWPAPQLTDAAVRQSRGRDAPDGGHEPRADPNRPRRVLPTSRVSRGQGQGDHRDRPQASGPRLPDAERRDGLLRRRRRRLQRPPAYTRAPAASSTRRNPRIRPRQSRDW